MVVIGLIGILLAMATFGFNQYATKTRITAQTRQLYGNLMEYRQKAFYEKKNWTFKFSTTGYGIYSSANTAVPPVSSVTLKYPVTLNNNTDVSYDSQGLANVSGKSICVIAENSAIVDALVLSQTRIQIGKRRAGSDCDESYIDAK